MLREITIENVAVIEKATAGFGPGLNVLSGETGAGKSILIDSINAILGNRTSRELVRSQTPKAKIWATFQDVDEKTRRRLEQVGYEAGDELLLYREISADGKSQCRVNGMPATAATVREICAGLLAIHGQHDSHSLTDPATHLGVLDAFAQDEAQHAAYYRVYRELCGVKKRLDALNADEDEKERRAQLLRFQIEELEMAQLEDGEEEALRERRSQIQHAQKITQQLAAAYRALNGEPDADVPGAAEMLGAASAALDGASALAQQLAPLAEKAGELFYAARDLESELAGRLDGFDFDEKALDEVEERLDVLYRLRQKYGRDVPQLLEYLAAAREELEGLESGEALAEELAQCQQELYERARALAEELTQTRLAAFERLEKELTAALRFLNMPGIRFALRHSRGPLASAGQDSVEFLLSANAGEEPKPLAKIASGGELSRIMLAMKSALADKDDIGTVIYDEIDTGVSGLAAARIGEKLRQTAQGRQVICITHTAQIAALADEHLLIRKEEADGRTFTRITPLEGEGRVAELARMISGDRVIDLALANAREMLALAHPDA